LSDAKPDFLIAYDDMGGLWGVLRARSAEEITRTYPELGIATARPTWMSAEQYDDLANTPSDIDGAP
jgi:hypothetical protein